MVYVIHHNKTTKAKKNRPCWRKDGSKTNAPKDTPVRSIISVSSSGSYRKRNTRSSLAVIFIPIFCNVAHRKD